MANVNAVKKQSETKEKGLTVFQPATGLVSQLTSLGVTIDTVGVHLPDTLTLKDCTNLMESITKFRNEFDGTYRWAVGDIVLHGQVKFGESKYSQILAHTGMEAGDARNCVWVSRQLPPSYRVVGLSWSHHRVVAVDEIPDLEEKHMLLLEAETNKMSVAQFKIHVENHIAGKNPKPKPSKPSPTSSPSATASNPPPPSYQTTSFQAVCKWAENASSGPEIQYLIETLIKKSTDIQFLAQVSVLADAIIGDLAKAIGMEGIPSANAEDDEDDPAANAIAALKSVGVDVYTPSGENPEYDEDGVLIEPPAEQEYVPIDELESGNVDNNLDD